MISLKALVQERPVMSPWHHGFLMRDDNRVFVAVLPQRSDHEGDINALS